MMLARKTNAALLGWSGRCAVGLVVLVGCGCNKPGVESGVGSTGGTAPTSAPPVATTPPTAPSATATGSGTVPTAAPACDATAPRGLAKRDLKKRLDTKIVGGTESPKGARPWMAAITTDGKSQYCGGTLIAKEWVLTAAHCQVSTTDQIIVGRHDLNDATTGKVVGISDVKIHAKYDDVTHDFDISLVRLKEALDIPFIELLSGTGDLASKDALVVGWGFVKEGGPVSSKLREVTVPIVSNDVCSEGYKPDHVGITSNMLCAGLKIGGKDSCQGDSGGPLLVTENNKLVQGGVVSFGVGCARPDRYGVYARLSQFKPWVEACMR